MSDAHRDVPPNRPVQEREIRVFVSSTFRDMRAEREELVKRVFPQLRYLCERRGVVWGDVDLRWGVTEEQQHQGLILPICLREIERCQPFFIGLLGDRYGSRLEKVHPEALAREPWLHDHLDRSITELEIMHGVLRNPAMAEHAFFYFRDPGFARGLPTEDRRDFQCEDAESSDRLAKLKQEIREHFPVRENYANAKALGQLVLSDFTALIDRLYPEGSQPALLDRETSEHNSYAASRQRVYIRRQTDFDRLDRHVNSSEEPLVVVGESGVGKSALLANWALRWRSQNPTVPMVLHFVGATPASSDWISIAQRAIHEFSVLAGGKEEIPDEAEKLRGALSNSIAKLASHGRVVLVLDGLNQLQDREGAQELAWLPLEIPPNVRVIVSTLEGKPLEEAKRRKWQLFTVQPLEPDGRRELIQAYLRQYAKELPYQQETFIADSKQTANPLFLRALLDELRVFGDYRAVDETTKKYLKAFTVAELYTRILERYEKDYDADRPGWVKDAFRLIWASRRGLSQVELLEALGDQEGPLPKAVWLALFYGAGESLLDRRGILTFSHPDFRRAVEAKYVATANDQTLARRRLAVYFVSTKLGPRKVQELPWLYEKCSDWDQLAKVLGDLKFLETAFEEGSYPLREYWTAVQQNSDHRALAVYAAVLSAPQDYGLQAFRVSKVIGALGHHQQTREMAERLVAYYRKTATPLIERLQSVGRRRVEAERADEVFQKLLDYVRKEDSDAPSPGNISPLELVEQISAKALGSLGKVSQFEPITSLDIALRNLASHFQSQGDLVAAMVTIDERKKLAALLGDNERMRAAVRDFATLQRSFGHAEAAKAAEEQDRLYERLDREQPHADSSVEAMRAYSQGDLSEALRLYTGAERNARAKGDVDELAKVLVAQATILSRRGDNAKALTLLDEADRLCAQFGHLEGRASILDNRAAIHRELGEYQAAVRLGQEAEQIATRLGDIDRAAVCATGQAISCQRLGDLDAAVCHFRRCIQATREGKHYRRAIDASILLAGLLRSRSNLEGALAVMQEAEKISRKNSDFDKLIMSLSMQSTLLIASGDWKPAALLNQEAETMARDMQNWGRLPLILNNRSMILRESKDLRGALESSEEEEAMCRKVKDIQGVTRAIENQAWLLRQLGKERRSEEKFRQARALQADTHLTGEVPERGHQPAASPPASSWFRRLLGR